jgi:hypothetical protein
MLKNAILAFGMSSSFTCPLGVVGADLPARRLVHVQRWVKSWRLMSSRPGLDGLFDREKFTLLIEHGPLLQSLVRRVPSASPPFPAAAACARVCYFQKVSYFHRIRHLRRVHPDLASHRNRKNIAINKLPLQQAHSLRTSTNRPSTTSYSTCDFD